MAQVQGTELMALSIKIRKKSEICITNELLCVLKLEYLRITPEAQSTLTSTLLNVKQGGKELSRENEVWQPSGFCILKYSRRN